MKTILAALLLLNFNLLAEEISSCQEISSPGQYVVTKPLSSSGNCLVIKSDDVQIDCQDNLISSDNSKNNNGIFAEGQKNLSITGCNIRGFENGIQIKNSDKIQISNNFIMKSGVYGLLIHYYTKNALIEKNTINSAGHVCMILSGGNGNDYSLPPANHIVRHNNLESCKDSGIHLYDSIGGVNAFDNQILNSGRGVSSDRGSKNKFVKTRISGAREGIAFVLSAQDNIFEDFSIDNTQTGILFEHWGQNNGNIFRNGHISSQGLQVKIDNSVNSAIRFYDTPINQISICPNEITVCYNEQCEQRKCLEAQKELPLPNNNNRY